MISKQFGEDFLNKLNLETKKDYVKEKRGNRKEGGKKGERKEEERKPRQPKEGQEQQ
jgi:hypothetical protein